MATYVVYCNSLQFQKFIKKWAVTKDAYKICQMQKRLKPFNCNEADCSSQVQWCLQKMSIAIMHKKFDNWEIQIVHIIVHTT